MEDPDQFKVFVGGISWGTTDDMLKEHFGKYGTVVNCVIAKDRKTGTPRGFGFVSFSDFSAMDQALQDTHQILARKVDVKKAIPRSEQSQIQQQQQQQTRGMNRNSRNNGRSSHQFRTKKIFVGGLSANLTQDEFKGYFEKFGPITDVVVMHDNVTNRPRGFGFITFDSEDAVDEVMQTNFHELTGKLVEVKRAVPKEGNGNGGNGNSSRTGGGRGSSSNYYQHGNYSLYSPQYVMPAGYSPVHIYGDVAAFSYLPSLICNAYNGAYNGISHSLASIMPVSPSNGPAMVGLTGNPLPYGSEPGIYPNYLNGALVDPANNVCNGIMGVGVNGNFSRNGIDDAQIPADRTASQIGEGAADVISSGSSGNNGAAASKEVQRG